MNCFYHNKIKNYLQMRIYEFEKIIHHYKGIDVRNKNQMRNVRETRLIIANKSKQNYELASSKAKYSYFIISPYYS